MSHLYDVSPEHPPWRRRKGPRQIFVRRGLGDLVYDFLQWTRIGRLFRGCGGCQVRRTRLNRIPIPKWLRRRRPAQ